MDRAPGMTDWAGGCGRCVTARAAEQGSSSDFEAYTRAGIPRERVFALRRVGAAGCQPGAWVACLPGWEAQRQALSPGP